jgi:hypothetical protein
VLSPPALSAYLYVSAPFRLRFKRKNTTFFRAALCCNKRFLFQPLSQRKAKVLFVSVLCALDFSRP